MGALWFEGTLRVVLRETTSRPLFFFGEAGLRALGALGVYVAAKNPKEPIPYMKAAKNRPEVSTKKGGGGVP